MNNKQQEQEAIEAYAKEIMKSGCVSNERDFLDGMLKGAKFALSELRKPSESRPQIVDFFDKDCNISDVQAELSKSHKLYNYTQALDSYIDQLESNPSKNSGKQESHQCKVCGLTYDNSTELYEHYNETHNNPIE